MAFMRDLAPSIYRQRLVIEAYPAEPISAVQIIDYLAGLAPVLDMKGLIEPVTHRSDLFGWAGWTHWETSGAHFYAWEQPVLFYSVDIYTCKPFDPLVAVEYTKNFFGSASAEYKEF
jgi:hypothetical protein